MLARYHRTLARFVALGAVLTAATASPSAAQSPPTPTLQVGQPVRASLQPGDTLRYAFEAGDNYLLYGEVDQLSVDVVVTLLDAEGRRLSAWDGPGRGPEPFSRPLRDAGTYTLQVTGFEDGDGEFVIRVDQLEAKSDDPRTLADQLMFAWDRPNTPGGAIRVWRDGETLYSKSWGLADLAWQMPFAEDTPTNIGSTSKQFTAFAVLLEQEAGRLSLDDSIRKWFPEFPEFTDPITLRHLLSHTSGLREFLNLYLVAGVPPSALGRSDVARVVERQPALQNEPGAEFNYNNTAFSLAAQIVEKTSGQAFDDYMREHVFAPLGMDDSYVRMTPSTLIPRRSEGYTTGAEGWTAPGDLGGAVGAGGIYASIADLERWGVNLLSENPVVGSRAIFDLMMTENLLTDGEGSGYGLGLFVDEQRGLARVHHGGADTSHRSMIIYYPELNAGLTAQGNAASFNSQGTAIELGAAWFGDEMEPESGEAPVADDAAPFDPASFDPVDFEPFAGSYTLDPAPQITARMWYDEEAGTFRTQLTGQPAVEIRPTAPNRFEIVTVDATLVFEAGEPAPGFTLFQNGQEIHATRVQTAQADADADGDGGGQADSEPWAPGALALADFEGRFFSDEIETFFTLRVEGPAAESEEGAADAAPTDSEPAPDAPATDAPAEEPATGARLVLSYWRGSDLPLTPTEPDTFTTVGLTLTFERDRNGQVIGFYVDATRSRDIRFGRVADAP